MQVRATREENTERFYFERLRLLSRWADQGISDQTRRHDAVSARVFLKFCKREDYVEGDPLAGYQVPKAERAYVKCPSDDETRTLLKAMHERWKPAANPASFRFCGGGAGPVGGRPSAPRPALRRY